MVEGKVTQEMVDYVESHREGAYMYDEDFHLTLGERYIIRGVYDNEWVGVSLAYERGCLLPFKFFDITKEEIKVIKRKEVRKGKTDGFKYTSEYVGDCEEPVKVVKINGKRKAIFPVDKDNDIRFEKGNLWINDVLWFGKWTIWQDLHGVFFVLVDLNE